MTEMSRLDAIVDHPLAPRDRVGHRMAAHAEPASLDDSPVEHLVTQDEDNFHDGANRNVMAEACSIKGSAAHSNPSGSDIVQVQRQRDEM